jgi:hypothetical protein
LAIIFSLYLAPDKRQLIVRPAFLPDESRTKGIRALARKPDVQRNNRAGVSGSPDGWFNSPEKTTLVESDNPQSDGKTGEDDGGSAYLSMVMAGSVFRQREIVRGK